MKTNTLKIGTKLFGKQKAVRRDGTIFEYDLTITFQGESDTCRGFVKCTYDHDVFDSVLNTVKAEKGSEKHSDINFLLKTFTVL